MPSLALPPSRSSLYYLSFPLSCQIVLELGTRFGGSTLYFADVMRTVHRKGTPYRILTVDIDRGSIDAQVSAMQCSSEAVSK